jgi:DUF917 family protein
VYERIVGRVRPMAKTSIRTVQECQDLAHGLVLLGTGGGGGSVQSAVDLLSQQLEAGRHIEFVGIDEIREDGWTVTVAGMGARSADEEDSKALMAQIGLTEEKLGWLDRLVEAVSELVDYGGVSLRGLVPAELGCFNTMGPIVAAARLGVPTIDGDYAGGRAIPEVGQMIPEVYGVPLCPMAFVDRWGDVCILKDSYNSAMADRIGRMLCQAAFEWVGAAWYLLEASETRRVIANNSLTRALEIGRARREALESGDDPVQAIVSRTGGWLLFKGTVLQEDRRKHSQSVMFNTGTHLIEGIDEYAGETLEIWYKNENHICWRNRIPYVTSPDLICIADLDTGQGQTTYEVSAGQRVAVVGMRAHAAHRTEKGVELLGPRHFGFDIDYVAIEEQVKG